MQKPDENGWIAIVVSIGGRDVVTSVRDPQLERLLIGTDNTVHDQVGWVEGHFSKTPLLFGTSLDRLINAKKSDMSVTGYIEETGVTKALAVMADQLNGKLITGHQMFNVNIANGGVVKLLLLGYLIEVEFDKEEIANSNMNASVDRGDEKEKDELKEYKLGTTDFYEKLNNLLVDAYPFDKTSYSVDSFSSLIGNVSPAEFNAAQKLISLIASGGVKKESGYYLRSVASEFDEARKNVLFNDDPETSSKDPSVRALANKMVDQHGSVDEKFQSTTSSNDVPETNPRTYVDYVSKVIQEAKDIATNKGDAQKFSDKIKKEAEDIEKANKVGSRRVETDSQDDKSDNGDTKKNDAERNSTPTKQDEVNGENESENTDDSFKLKEIKKRSKKKNK